MKSEEAVCKSVGRPHKTFHVFVIAAALNNKSTPPPPNYELKIWLSALRGAPSKGVHVPAEFVTRAQATFPQNRRDMLFFHISLPLKVLWEAPRRRSGSEELWPSELMFDQLPCFLPKQKATGGNRVYRAQRRSRSPVKSQGCWDARLVLLPPSTLQVHVKKKCLTAKQNKKKQQPKNTCTCQYDPSLWPSSAGIFKQTDFQRTLKRKIKARRNSCFREGWGLFNMLKVKLKTVFPLSKTSHIFPGLCIFKSFHNYSVCRISF